ncbi:hypothetical protein [Streptomyces fulvorobeus]|uniref:Uncharacterized protein n=1 Tax=Streptomyces fulvorobeus TaxID=284028 RepID=A0A7J0CE33_9ACTN|nr:hypothetical protein [Streptomyces fulvorobeus]NYE44212.1 hypothetical protein [Streptomyces fulvorobeus]GFN00726.1 hypothetical protein Sfulv_55360 [Streptomyces fulvorobeus]
MKRLTAFLSDLTLRAYVALQVLAATEPVRLRAHLLALVAAGAFFIPALADADVAQSVAGVGAVALPILVGESARRKVSPAE